MRVVEVKQLGDTNTEFVICASESQKWGAARKFTFLAPLGTHRNGNKIQVSYEVEPTKENEA